MSTATASPPKKIHEMNRHQKTARRAEIIEMGKELPAIIEEGQAVMGFGSPTLFTPALLRDPRVRHSERSKQLLERYDEINRALIEKMHLEESLRTTDVPPWIDAGIEPLKRVAIGLLQRSNATKESIDDWQGRRPVDDARGLQSWQLGLDKLHAELAEIDADNSRVQGEMGVLANLKLTEV